MKSKILALAALGIASLSMQAQTVVATDYVEAAVSDNCGTFSVPGIPPGTNFNSSGASLVADHDRDGWAVGTPDRCGDYIYPGSPEDSWGIQYNGSVLVSNSQSFSCGVTGSNTLSGDVGAAIVNVWQGNVGGLAIQKTTINLKASEIVLHNVRIYNGDSANVDSLYYMHNYDPDNDFVASGNFLTAHRIFSQPPGTDALISAQGTVFSQCELSLLARDDRARVSYGSFSFPFSPILDDVWAGTDPFYFSTLTANTADEANQITFNLGTLATGSSTCFTYAWTTDETLNGQAGNLSTLACGIVPDFISGTAKEADWSALNAALPTEKYEIVAQPNPVSNGYVNLDLGFLSDQSVLEVYDLSGRLVDQQSVNQGWYTLNTADYTPGMYIVTVNDRGQKFTKKLIIE
jgi:hypothetical protein